MKFDDLPEKGPFPSKRDFYNFHLSVSTFDASTTQKAVLRVYEDLNCGAAYLNKQQVGGAAEATEIKRIMPASSSCTWLPVLCRAAVV